MVALIFGFLVLWLAESRTLWGPYTSDYLLSNWTKNGSVAQSIDYEEFVRIDRTGVLWTTTNITGYHQLSISFVVRNEKETIINSDLEGSESCLFGYKIEPSTEWNLIASYTQSELESISDQNITLDLPSNISNVQAFSIGVRNNGTKSDTFDFKDWFYISYIALHAELIPTNSPTSFASLPPTKAIMNPTLVPTIAPTNQTLAPATAPPTTKPTAPSTILPTRYTSLLVPSTTNITDEGSPSRTHVSSNKLFLVSVILVVLFLVIIGLVFVYCRLKQKMVTKHLCEIQKDLQREALGSVSTTPGNSPLQTTISGESITELNDEVIDNETDERNDGALQEGEVETGGYRERAMQSISYFIDDEPETDIPIDTNPSFEE